MNRRIEILPAADWDLDAPPHYLLEHAGVETAL